MSRIHILRQAAFNTYEAVVHAPVPAGNNAAGFLWSDCIKAARMNTSALTVGNGPAQIQQNEMNGITNGAIIEAFFVWVDNPEASEADREASQNFEATRAVARTIERIMEELRFYGLQRA